MCWLASHLATSLAADLQLIGASLMYGYATYVSTAGLNEAWTASVVSLSGGALHRLGILSLAPALLVLATPWLIRRGLATAERPGEFRGYDLPGAGRSAAPAAAASPETP